MRDAYVGTEALNEGNAHFTPSSFEDSPDVAGPDSATITG